jgi:hypothetical protein
MLNDNETNDQDDQAAVAPLSPKHILALKITIGVMSVLIVLGISLLIGTLIYKASTPNLANNASQGQTSAPLPFLKIPLKHDSKVVNVMTTQGRLVVHTRGEKGDEIFVIDLATGWQQQRIMISRPQ